MKAEERIPSKFVDGVEKLHHDLYEAHLKAEKLISKLIGKPEPCNDRAACFYIYVDFEENQPENRIKGYFTNKYTILRFLPVEFDYALLFPVKNHGGGTFQQASGINFIDIQQAKSKGRKLFFRFVPIKDIETEENKILYSIKIWEGYRILPLGSVVDDIGMPYYSFHDVERLAVADVPSDYLSKQYTLVDNQIYAPLTHGREKNCILFAQLDNEYDENAIKVLRWFPVKNGVEADQLLGVSPDGGDYFFELGYVSRSENAELHKYMVENDSRFLFGKAIGNRITIEGGVKIFKTNDLKYPRCLYNIKLL